jgi:hypothetical protein
MTEVVSTSDINLSEDPICSVCVKTVHKYERVDVGGCAYHVADCFRCGLDGNVGCGKNLHRDNYFEQLGKPFCNKCFSKHFLVGFGSPQSNKQDFMVAIESITLSPNQVLISQNNKITNNNKPKVLQTISETTTISNNNGEIKLNVVDDNASSNVETPKEEDSNSDNKSNQTKVEVPKGSTAAKVLTFSPTGKTEAKKCRNCTKTVYPAELCMAAGFTWHKTCFTCGYLPEGEEDPHNGSGQGCGRVLPQDKYHLSCGIAFCNGCFTRLFTTGAARGAILRKKAINVRQVHDNIEQSGDNTETGELDGFMAGSVFQEKKQIKQPRVTNVGSIQGEKCPSCSKTVYKMEALLAIGQSWHKPCFTCGGPGNVDNLGCKRSLPQDNFQQHNMLPYCQACFMKNFSSTFKSRADRTLPASNVAIDTSSGLSFADRAALFKQKVHEGTEVTSPSLKKQGSKLSIEGGKKCPVCSKSVYKMEEVLAIGQAYHQTCFTCGALGDGSKFEGCGKVLSRDQYLEGQSRPFCKNCYQKNFSNKGLQPSA